MVGPNCKIDVKISLFLIIYMAVKYYSLVSVGLLIGLLCATQPDPKEELLCTFLGASRWWVSDNPRALSDSAPWGIRAMVDLHVQSSYQTCTD